MARRMDVLRGTLDLLVLRTLDDRPLHGYALAKAIQATTDEVLQLEEGSLYPALYRMERKGWIESEWSVTDTGRRAKVYRLTAEGERELEQQEADWKRFSVAVGKVLARR